LDIATVQIQRIRKNGLFRVRFYKGLDSGFRIIGFSYGSDSKDTEKRAL